MKYKLQVLSPVHIGNGQKLNENLDFLLYRNKIKVFSFDKLLSFLREEELESLIDDRGSIKTNILKTKAEKHIDSILKYDMYTDVSDAVKDVSQFVKTAYKDKLCPYIPGSEIKGFIRTAILYNAIKNNFNKYIVEFNQNSARYQRNKKPKEDNFANDFVSEKIFVKKYEKSKYHLTKDLLTSDSEPICTNKLYVGMSKVFGTKRDIKEYIECLEQGTETTIDIKINQNTDRSIQNYATINNWMRDCYNFTKDLIQEEKRYWLRINHPSRTKVLELLEKIEAQNKEDAPVLRIGKFCGYLSVTVAMALRGKNDMRIKNTKTRRITNSNELFGFIKLSKISS